jgi:hypothetical protein
MVRLRGRPAAMKIDQLFAAGNFNDPDKLEWVRQEAEYVMKILEADPNYAMAERLKQVLPPENLLHYFRRRERMERVRCILQYLLTFLGHIPSEEDVRRDLANPAEQLRSFVACEADLLLEPDVRDAVFQEMRANGLPKAGGGGDCEERILLINRMLKGLLARGEGDIQAAIVAMCRAVEQLARFWFDVHDNDIRRVRRSDIFMFLLANLVRSRCWRPPGA